MKKIGEKSVGQPNLDDSLNKYIEAKELEELNRPYSANFIDDDDDYDYYSGYYDGLLYPENNSRLLRSLLEDDGKSCNDEDDEFDADEYLKHSKDKKSIYYYPNILDEYSRIEFSTLKEFNDFCDKHGYLMSNKTANDMIKGKVMHCTLDPTDKIVGDFVIVADRSYGGLYYSVCDDLYDEEYN